MVDDRLRNIREGAGKEDSRYSELMTDLLQKSGPWVMGAVIICSGGYLAYKWYDNHKTQKLAAAFFELEEAINSGSPKSLEAVATEHAGQRSVTSVAQVELGEVYLTAARRGVAPGATLVPPVPAGTEPDPAAPAPKPEGTPEHDEDLLTPDQVNQYITKAAAAFQSTFDATKDDPALALHTIKALFGLAAAAETKGDLEAAGRYYTDAAARATKAGFEPLATLANKRKDTAPSLSAVSPLLKVTDLPAKIVAAPPFPTAPTGMTPPGAPKSTIDVKNPGAATIIKGSGPIPTSPIINPTGPSPAPAEGPAGPPAPAPAPAPSGDQPKGDAPATPPATPPAAPPANPSSEPKPKR